MIPEFLNSFEELSLVQWIICAAFVFILLVRLLYSLLFTTKIISKNKKELVTLPEEPVSLVFTLRNEEENVKRVLPVLLEAEKNNLELVVVDDFSEDATLSVLGLLKQRYPHLKISTLSQETRFSVKLAQNIALKSASNQWVKILPITMQSVAGSWFDTLLAGDGGKERNVVLAYSSVLPAPGFFNKLYRIENFFQYVRSVGFIGNRIPFVYSEENVAFRKEKYFEMGGFGPFVQESYVNLELIINSFIKTDSTVIFANEQSSIRKNDSVHKADYIDLLKKCFRIERHLSFGKLAVLRLEELSLLMFLPLLAISLLIVFKLWPLLLGFTAVLLVTQMLIIKISLNRLNERKIFISSLVYGLVMPYFKMFYRWHFIKTSRKNKWRKRV